MKMPRIMTIWVDVPRRMFEAGQGLVPRQILPKEGVPKVGAWPFRARTGKWPGRK